MIDELIELLESFGYPVFRQGSLTEDTPYPDSFFTFWNTSSPDHAYYDNVDYGSVWDFDVNAYSNDPEKTYELIESARSLLKRNGWIIPNRGYDLPTDEPTHTGRGMNAIYLETIKQ